MPAGDKEVRFFDNNFAMGAAWYRGRLLGDARDGTRRSMFARPIRAIGRKLLGEATPYYLFHPAVPDRVKATSPEVKLIVLLRDPVARAYSQYQHSVARGHEPLTFEDALDAEPHRLAGEEEKLLADPMYTSFSHRHHSYCSRGVYVDQLVRWMERFAPERFLIISSEDLFADPRTELGRVFDHLELQPYELDSYPRLNVSAHGPRVSDQTNERLRTFFRPHNERLYVLLGRDFGWDAR